MKLLRPGKTTIDVVWSLDPDVVIPDNERKEPATDTEGKPSLEGRCFPLDAVTINPGAAVFSIRPLTVKEYTALTPDSTVKNTDIVKQCVLRCRIHGTDEVYEGDSLALILESNGLELIGDLAHCIWQCTANPFFRKA